MSLFSAIRRALFGPPSSEPRDPAPPVAAPPGDARGEPPASTSNTYLSEEEAAFHLVRDERGRLPVTISGGWFQHEATGKRVGPANRALTKAGVYSFNVRGDNYRDDEVTAADTRPGTVAELRREPENPHDSNAILVLGRDASDDERAVGYVNKGLARSLARRLDAGDDLEARFMRGEPGGRRSQRVAVVVSDAATMRGLFPG